MTAPISVSQPRAASDLSEYSPVAGIVTIGVVDA